MRQTTKYTNHTKGWSAGLRPSAVHFLFVCLVYFVVCKSDAADFTILKPATFAHHVERFNASDAEVVANYISNAQSWDWMQKTVPLFECPDAEVEQIYYFRWWVFRKHIKQTPKGFIVTEFLTPVSHAGEYNAISSAAGLHLSEGRWLRNDRYMNDYTKFWLTGDRGKPMPRFHHFSSWFAAAVYDRYLVNMDRKFITSLLNDLAADYRQWEAERQLTNGLFWQHDVKDAMEESISGSRTARNIRPTINSYMYANARAIADIAVLAQRTKLAQGYTDKAAELRRLTLEHLWDPDAQFFKARLESGELADVREELGYIPWMFQLPLRDKGYEEAWSQLMNPAGFRAPFGITTAERRHPEFRANGFGTCEWDGAVWPFATSQTLSALGNVLRDYRQTVVTRHDYFDAFLTYVHSQHADGEPYIGEYLDEVTGDWINGKNDRSRFYNHSLFADLLITGVVGLRPRANDLIEVDPLLPMGKWDWFCLDGVNYHGRMLTILWDKDGSRYQQGAGLSVFVDGKQIAHSDQLTRLEGKLP